MPVIFVVGLKDEELISILLFCTTFFSARAIKFIGKNADYVIIECCVDKESFNKDAPTENEISNFLYSKGFKYKLLLEEHLWVDKKKFSFAYGDIFQKDYLFTRTKMNKSFYLKLNYIFNFLKRYFLKLKKKIYLT